jgi:hypothetical protein
MPRSKLTIDSDAIGSLLNSEPMAEMVRSVAELIMARAVSMSPVGDPKDDPHSGRYLASWRVDVRHHSGATGDRVEAVVSNDAPEAFWVEYGHHGREPYYTLRRAAIEVSWLW